ncbi:MAG: 6-phosphogluconolactonase [Blastocatellia bacterium]|nr:6-phosphogluconolactonase [Blastocatellia bacterium]
MIEIFDDKDAVYLRAAELIIEKAAEAIEERGSFSLVLAGGSTPRGIYQLLASPNLRERIDWPRVVAVIGDERNVSPDHADSNYRMVRENLLEHVPIPENAVVRWEPEIGNPDEVALNFEKQLTDKLGPAPTFDLVLLGLGDDGHTASLFPGTSAIKEPDRYAVANNVPQLSTDRFTLTFPAVNNAANVAFVVTGRAKAAAVSAVIDQQQFPAARIIPKAGRLYWLLDTDAASLLAAR